MEINIYDKQFTYIGVIDTIISLMWTRSYWDTGNFKLLVPFTDNHSKWLQEGNLITKKGDTEAGEITYIHISQTADGTEQIEIQGQFITNWLNDRCVLSTQKIKKPSANVIEQLIAENATNPQNPDRIIPQLAIIPTAVTGDDIEYATERGLSLLLSVSSIAKAAKLGFRITLDLRKKKFYFNTYKGLDRTAQQDENDKCIFAIEYDNIYQQEYTNSIENKKTVAYVLGEEKENQPQELITVGAAAGFERKEMFISATDISKTITEGETETILTDEEYRKLLSQRGIEGLEQNAQTLSFESNVKPNANLKYKEDFDIGDRVTCKNRRWGIQVNVRITSITENFQQDKNNIDITFGESLPTLTEKIKKMR